MKSKTKAATILSGIECNLRKILSLIQPQYKNHSAISEDNWLLLNTMSHKVIRSLKVIRDEGGPMFTEGSMLKWDWTKDMSSTRISKLNGWQITHDHWLYNVFVLTPPSGTFHFSKVVVSGETYSIDFENSKYNIDIPSSMSLHFKRVNCSHGMISEISMYWLLDNGEWYDRTTYHRENHMPAKIVISKKNITLDYYLHGLRHDENRYYGFESRSGKDGLIEIKCPECYGKGRRTYQRQGTGYSPGGLGWSPISYVTYTPYEDKCHMCALPLEKNGKGWIAVTESNEAEIKKMALKQ